MARRLKTQMGNQQERVWTTVSLIRPEKSMHRRPYGRILINIDAKTRRKNMGNQPPARLVPPFTKETAIAKVRKAEDAWNSRDPQRVALAYTEDCRWRNRAEFIDGREQIIQFLTRKWNRELDYRLIKELWAFDGARIAVRFAYEWHDDSG